MKLSSGWEQSVFVLLILAELPKNKSLNSAALAERLEVSPSYLKKIIKSLVNEDLIKSNPGKNGGFSLALPLSEITFYKVFIAVEGHGKIFASQHLLANFLNIDKEKVKSCAITNALDAVEKSLIENMNKISLAQLLAEIKVNYQISDLEDWIAEKITV